MKELQFKQNKGFWGVLITGVIFAIVGIAFIIWSTMNTAENMYNSGDLYGKKAVKQGDTIAVAITATSGEMTTQNGNSYYIIETEDAEYIALEVPEKFSQINKEEGSEFDPPLKLAVKVGKWEATTQTKWLEVARRFGIHSDFERIYFLSTVDYENSKMWMMIFAAGAIILGGVIIFSAFKKRKNNAASYIDLIGVYPELRDNLNVAKTEGVFASEVLNFYIYKNHLLNMRTGFEVIDLSQVTWIDFTTTTYRGNTTAQLPYLLNGESKQKMISFGNYGKKHIEDMQRLFETFEQHFSHIALGSENRPEQLGGKTGKKTIAEFVAEQEAKATRNSQTKVEQEDVPKEEIVQEVVENQEEVADVVETVEVSSELTVDTPQIEESKDEA